MAFIKTIVETGRKVRLTRDIKVNHGYFEKGTEMTIIGKSERGFNLVDNEGNHLRETALLGDFFEPVDN